MSNPILTIAVPTYNRKEKLNLCVKHIMNQIENKNIEVIVFDNASTDGTKELMQKICSQYSLIKYFRNEKNIGPDRNFLKCYQHAQGEYVLLLGDDDILLSGAVDSILMAIKKKPVFLHLNSSSLIDEMTMKHTKAYFKENELLRYEDKNDFLNQIGIRITFVSSLVMRTDLINKVENKEQYIGSYFIQSHIALQTMQQEGEYIINTYNCLAASPNVIINYDLYYVWFKCFQDMLIKTGEKSNFNPEILNHIYQREILSTVCGFIIKFRRTCRQENKWDKTYVVQSIKKYKKLKILVNALIFCPKSCLPIADFAIHVIRKLKKVVKYN